MAKKNMAKKTTKKFEMKRSDIAAKLSDIIGTLDDLNINSTSPDDMIDALGQLSGALEKLYNGIESEVN